MLEYKYLYSRIEMGQVWLPETFWASDYWFHLCRYTFLCILHRKPILVSQFLCEGARLLSYKTQNVENKVIFLREKNHISARKNHISARKNHIFAGTSYLAGVFATHLTKLTLC